jgi:hypothetical protein
VLHPWQWHLPRHIFSTVTQLLLFTAFPIRMLRRLWSTKQFSCCFRDREWHQPFSTIAYSEKDLIGSNLSCQSPLQVLNMSNCRDYNLSGVQLKLGEVCGKWNVYLVQVPFPTCETSFENICNSFSLYLGSSLDCSMDVSFFSFRSQILSPQRCKPVLRAFPDPTFSQLPSL